MATKSGLPPGKNRLALEKSPYLQQHADNPVDWYPWGNEAITRARELNRLIFLSVLLMTCAVGYSTCHWCHVMERESFSDVNIARLLNDNYVPIKVDREERPDVDQVYMTFVQATTGGGGWPMSVWLTPSLKPIIGGTYFPPEDAHGRPGFKTILQRISAEWRLKRDRLEHQGNVIFDALRAAAEGGDSATGEAAPAEAAAGELSQQEGETVIAKCYQQLAASYETRFGGFSRAPKFPTPVNLGFLLALSEYERTKLVKPEAAATASEAGAAADMAADDRSRSPKSGAGSDRRSESLEMVAHTLRCMARGGIHDHLGLVRRAMPCLELLPDCSCNHLLLGFHRYSVDSEWHVPHFEKMLYDQAQLADLFASAALLCNDEHLATVCDGIITYVNRELAHPAGGYYSGEDADSLPPPTLTPTPASSTDGAAAAAHSAAENGDSESQKQKQKHQQKREGAFYVWTFDEVRRALGADSGDADLFAGAYTVEPGGNTNPANDPHGELEGFNVLIMKKPVEELAANAKLSRDELEARLAVARRRLFELREKRPRPHRDSKFVTAWNALMISGLARAARLLQRTEYAARAVKAADFLLEHLWDESSARLWHVCYAEPDASISRGEQPIEAFDRDWAFLVRAMLDLFGATGSTRYLRLAFRMQRRFDELFCDERNGGYFSTTGKDESVLMRMKEDNDGAEPSSSSVALSNLIRLHRISALFDPEFLQKNGFELPDAYLKRADRIAQWNRERLEKIPISMTELCRSLIKRVSLGSSSRQAVLVGPSSDATVRQIWTRMQRSLHVGTLSLHLNHFTDSNGTAAEDADRRFWSESSRFLNEFLKAQLPPGQFRLYLCRNQTCQLPITEADAALHALDEFLF